MNIMDPQYNNHIIPHLINILSLGSYHLIIIPNKNSNIFKIVQLPNKENINDSKISVELACILFAITWLNFTLQPSIIQATKISMVSCILASPSIGISHNQTTTNQNLDSKVKKDINIFLFLFCNRDCPPLSVNICAHQGC